jgi:peptidoglycan/xylan/chitin deacetylase (PgdA/CDA1 family)
MTELDEVAEPIELETAVALVIWPEPVRNAPRTVQHPGYVREILGHAGLCYEEIAPEAIRGRLPHVRLLLTVGDGRPDDELREGLREWVESGGAWLSVGGCCDDPELFGVAPEEPAYSGWAAGVALLGEGYLHPEQAAHPALRHIRNPLHFFGGAAVRAETATRLASGLDSHGRPTGRAVMTERTVGAGRAMVIAADVTGTVVRIQQGTGVACDGVPAQDGSAALCDAVLKSDDGAVLDWQFDRQPVPKANGLCGFLEPVADLWREILLRSLLHLALEARVALPLLWLYPHNLPALAVMSHDTDMNDPERAMRLLEVLREEGIRSTWCVILPGYPPELLQAIRDAGHELAMHYDALDFPWSEEEFERQHGALVELFEGRLPITNKNHFLRWEGYAELWEWCERLGILVDQSKGASKTGEAGFNFGTCHPYRPVRNDGSVIDVMEVATPTQDLVVFAPPALLPPLLAAVMERHGVLHLLFHPAHILTEGVAGALAEAARSARERGMEWRTAGELALWERARRAARWQSFRQTGEEAAVEIYCEEALPGATLFWLAPEPDDDTRGGVAPPVLVGRWGFRFGFLTLDLPAGGVYRIDLRAEPAGDPPQAT